MNLPMPSSRPPKAMAKPTARKAIAAGAEVDQVLHHDVGDALGPGEPGLDEREAGLHEDDQHGGQQDEDVVEVGLDVGGLDLLGAGRTGERDEGAARPRRPRRGACAASRTSWAWWVVHAWVSLSPWVSGCRDQETCARRRAAPHHGPAGPARPGRAAQLHGPGPPGAPTPARGAAHGGRSGSIGGSRAPDALPAIRTGRRSGDDAGATAGASRQARAGGPRRAPARASTSAGG